MGTTLTRNTQCCVVRDDADALSSERASGLKAIQPLPVEKVPVEKEIAGLRENMESLRGVVTELHSEMNRLRQENGKLLEANSNLSSVNRKLNRNLSEHEAARTWAHFDIVEEHYREIERHRRRITASADSSESDLEELHQKRSSEICAAPLAEKLHLVEEIDMDHADEAAGMPTRTPRDSLPPSPAKES
mmetsp:Transcript_56165/g.87465  ORF Transcript_56165/g.87465 Transcript_56165/m.87465 type:complete len:190 (-) Transcript_56165:169-738(-)